MDKSKKDAIVARLEKIAGMNGGRLTPDAVLLDAKSAKSPLHDQFEWDDSVAAIQYRLTQARELIRSVKVEIETVERIISTVRYVRDPSVGEEQGYIDTAVLRDDKALARDALRAELLRARALFDRAYSLAEALGLAGEFAAIQLSVNKLRVRLDQAA